MKLLDILACFALVSAASAASFIVPVHLGKSAIDTRTRSSEQLKDEATDSSRSRRRNLRGPLSQYLSGGRHYLSDFMFSKSASFKVGDSGDDGTPVWDIEEVSYITTLSIGTPPQPFNALLSISNSDLTIPSSTCDYRCGKHSAYDEALSSTKVHHSRRFTAEYLRGTATNLLSEDTLHFGGIEIKHQKFGAADDMARWPFPPYWGWDDSNWDGILGLAPTNDRSPLGLLNPLQNMKEQELLDRSMFSLKLPRGDEPGELLFGDVNEELYVGKLKSLPVVSDPILLPRLKGSWAVPATSLSIGNGTASLKGYVATLESDFPLIGLPDSIVMLLLKYLGMERKTNHDMEPPSIDCARREELENLTISLGKHDFVITPWEYTMEMKSEVWGGKRCMTALYPMPDLATNHIALGSSFLKRFYSVFDLDNRSVSFAELASRRDSDNYLEKLGELKR